MKMKREYGSQIELHIVMKDYKNAISEIHSDAENINMILPLLYTNEKLEVLLHD